MTDIKTTKPPNASYNGQLQQAITTLSNYILINGHGEYPEVLANALKIVVDAAEGKKK